MTDSVEIFALLWSRSSNCFHVEPLEQTAKNGMRFFQRESRNDYLLIGYGSHEQVCELAEKLRPIINERAEVRRLYDDGRF